REAMLDQRHHHRVEQLRLARLRRASGKLEEGHVAEVELAEDLPRQVLAAYHDALGARPGEIGTDRLARHQSTFARLAISASRNCAACSGLPPTGSMPICACAASGAVGTRARNDFLMASNISGSLSSCIQRLRIDEVVRPLAVEHPQHLL